MPKTLAERLEWMADHLPGFREELEAVNEIQRRAHARSAARAASMSAFSYRVVCRSGVLAQGERNDFLVCIATGREKLADCVRDMPGITLRLQFFYPNHKRVPAADLAAAIAALNAPPRLDVSTGLPTGPSVAEVVARRRAVAAQVSPARSVARTAEICAPTGGGLATAADAAFCQAGVVAPPDSLTDGISVVEGSFGMMG